MTQCTLVPHRRMLVIIFQSGFKYIRTKHDFVVRQTFFIETYLYIVYSLFSLNFDTIEDKIYTLWQHILLLLLWHRHGKQSGV